VRRQHRSKRAAVLAVLASFAVAGCSGTANPNTPAGRKQIVKEAAEVAATRAKQGDPCEAAKIATPLAGEEQSAADKRYERECTQQKNEQAREKEVKNAQEQVREAERLKGEGR
jgi:cytochrome c556